jgi:serine/threonine protein kinase
LFILFPPPSAGKVYLGTFKGNDVAIKLFRGLSREDDEKEANMFAKLHSPFIVTFYGISVCSSRLLNIYNIFLFSLFFSLSHYLHSIPFNSSLLFHFCSVLIPSLLSGASTGW